MSESLVLQQPQPINEQIVPFTTTQLTDSEFWEDPETHGEVDLVFKQVDKMKSKSLPGQSEATEEGKQYAPTEVEIEREKEKEEMEREKKEKMETKKKEEMERQKKKEEIEKKEKEDKERENNEKEEKEKEETISVSKIHSSYLDDVPSFSLGFTPEEENEEKEEKKDKEKKHMKLVTKRSLVTVKHRYRRYTVTVFMEIKIVTYSAVTFDTLLVTFINCYQIT